MRKEYRCTTAMYRENECPTDLYHCTGDEVSLNETKAGYENHVSDLTRGLSKDIEFSKVEV